MSFVSFPLALTLSALLPFAPRVDDKVPTTPRECVEEVKAYRMAEIFAVGYFDAPYIPKDEIEKKVSVRAKDCGDRFANTKVTGKQIDAMAQLAVLAGNDQAGRDLFAKRLAEPGITAREKALANFAAVQSFADATKPARIAIAEEYLKALDAMPAADAGEQAAYGHMTLANVYRLLGKYPEQITHGMQGLKTAQGATKQERMGMVLSGELISAFGDLAETYVTMTDGKAKIDAAADIMLKPTNTTDDPMIKDGLERAYKRAGMLGRVAPAIVANHWFNREAPPNGTMDPKGTVPHVVEFTMFG